jgi:CD7 antigen
MKKIWPQAYNVIYFEDRQEPTVDRTFSGRINFSGSQKNLTITISSLQLADTGDYTCEAVRKVSARGLFTTVVVKGKDVPI